MRHDISTHDPRDVIRNIAPGEDGIWRTLVNSAVHIRKQATTTCFGVEDACSGLAPPKPLHRRGRRDRRHPRACPSSTSGAATDTSPRCCMSRALRTIPWNWRIGCNARARPPRARAGIDRRSRFPYRSIGGDRARSTSSSTFRTTRRVDPLVTPPALRRIGRIYATVPAHAWLWSSADDHAGHQRRYSKRHHRTLPRVRLRAGACVVLISAVAGADAALKRVLLERLCVDNATTPDRAKSEHGAVNR